MSSKKFKDKDSRFKRAVNIFRKHDGMMRTSEALRAGVHPSTLYTMRDNETLIQVSRGLYRLSDLGSLDYPDLSTVSARIPGAVICLISALAFHELTTQIPHKIHVALPRGAEEPRLKFPPLKTYRFTGKSFSEGVEKHKLDNVIVKVYDPEKTLADCFKFRNRLGLDTVIEALRFYRERKRVKVNNLMYYAEICRVKKIIRPYLEAIL